MINCWYVTFWFCLRQDGKLVRISMQMQTIGVDATNARLSLDRFSALLKSSGEDDRIVDDTLVE